MALLERVMVVYQYLFHPGLVLAGSLLALAYRDWSRDRSGVRSLGARVGALLGVELVALVPVGLYLLARRPPVTRLTAGTDWRINVVTAVSLVAGGTLLWLRWSTKPWGSEVINVGLAVVAAAVPYALVSPVWNVSGHVAFTLVPTLSLALADRRFRALVLIPLLMVANRPILGAHTWPESLGGLVLGTAAVVAARRRRA